VGSPWQIAMASGWKSEGLGFEPSSSRQPLSPDCQKNNKWILSQKWRAFNE